MEKIILHKNKDEVFKCKLNIEGSDKTVVRLCMEFEDNKNLFFYGNLSKNGECVVNIPKLKEFESKSGKLFLEAVADDTYFKLYETNFELKNSVEIKVENIETKEFNKEITQKEDVKIENITIESVEPVANPFLKKTTPTLKSKFNSWKPK